MSLERRTPLRRTPLAWGSSELKRSELKRGPSELKRTPIRQRSAKRSKFMADERAPLVRRLNEEGVGCRVCPLLRRVGIATRCAGRIEGIHERRKRSAGGSLTNPKGLIPCCNWSNGFIEDEPRLVRELTGDLLIVREGDSDWHELSARNDRLS